MDHMGCASQSQLMYDHILTSRWLVGWLVGVDDDDDDDDDDGDDERHESTQHRLLQECVREYEMM